MKSRTVVVLLSLLLVCVAYVAVRQAGLFDRTPGDDQATTGKVFPQAPSGAHQLKISPDEGMELLFEKFGGDWHLIEPLRAKADNHRVNGVTDMLLGLTFQRQIKSGDEEAADSVTGLDVPRWTVTLIDQDEKSFALAVGRDLPKIGTADAATYVRSGNSTFVVKEDLTDKLSRSLADFRSKNILDLKREKIVRVGVSAAENYELARTGENWGIVRPVSARADKDKVKDFLDKFTSLDVEEFVDDAPASLVRYGLDKPALILRIQMAPPEPASKSASMPATAPAPQKGIEYALALGSTVGEGDDKKVFAKLLDEAPVFKVKGSLLKDLRPRLIDLRDKKVLAINTGDVERVEVHLSDPSRLAELVKKDGRWRMAVPLAGKAGQERVTRLLDKVESLKAENFIDTPDAAGPRGLAPPLAKIILHLTGTGQTPTLLIGAKSPSGDKTFVKSATAAAVAVVPTNDVKLLLADPPTYWDPALLELPDDEKATHVVRREAGKPAMKLRKDENGNWQLTAPVEAPADKSNVDTVIDKLEQFEATKVVAIGPKVPEKYAKAAKQIVVEISTSTPPAEGAAGPAVSQPASAPTSAPASRPAPKAVVRTHRIRVAKIGLHAYGWVEGGDVVAVGEFASGLYDDLAAELRDRAVWTITPDETETIKIIPGEKPLELQRDGKNWIYATDRHVTIDADKVKTFLDDIKELKAQRFVSYTSADAGKFGLDKPWLTLALTARSGEVMRMTVANEGIDKTSNRYAMVEGLDGIFLLSSDDIGKLSKLPEDFKK